MDLLQPNENISCVDVTEDISQPERADVNLDISQPERIGIPADILQCRRVESRRKTGEHKPQTVSKSIHQYKNSKSSKGKEPNLSQPSTSEMVMESIKCLKMRNGATEEAIRKYMEDNYNVNVKERSRHIKQCLMIGVKQGLLEKGGGDDGVQETFKMKKESVNKTTEEESNLTENHQKDAKNINSSKGKERYLFQLPTTEMVIESIKCLKMRYGATEEAISKFIGDNYDVSIKARSRNIKQLLMNCVEKGLLERVGGDRNQERFAIKKKRTKKATEQKKNGAEEQKNAKKA